MDAILKDNNFEFYDGAVELWGFSRICSVIFSGLRLFIPQIVSIRFRSLHSFLGFGGATAMQDTGCSTLFVGFWLKRAISPVARRSLVVFRPMGCLLISIKSLRHYSNVCGKYQRIFGWFFCHVSGFVEKGFMFAVTCSRYFILIFPSLLISFKLTAFSCNWGDNLYEWTSPCRSVWHE